MATATTMAESTMHRHLPILWMCSGFLALMFILSFTGNGTIGAGVPVWLSVTLALAAVAVGIWAAARATR